MKIEIESEDIMDVDVCGEVLRVLFIDNEYCPKWENQYSSFDELPESAQNYHAELDSEERTLVWHVELQEGLFATWFNRDIFISCDRAYLCNEDYREPVGWNWGNGLKTSHTFGSKLWDILEGGNDE